MSLGFTKERNMIFKDGASIAQEIAYSEEKACKDANYVVDLSNPKYFSRKVQHEPRLLRLSQAVEKRRLKI